jgi:hypothetical protein
VNSPTEALAAFNRSLLEQVMKPFSRDGRPPSSPEVMQSLAASIAQDSQRWLDIQNRYYRKQLELWSAFTSQPPDAAPPKCGRARGG